MTKQTLIKHLPRIMLFASFIVLSVLLYTYSSPDKIIALIGIHNAYALIFILALLGGRFAFSAVPYHFVLITLATGGANPFLIGGASALGVTLGDAASYFIGYQGSVIVSKATQRSLQILRSFGPKHPRLLPVLFFMYGALSPLSNDFITVATGLSRYPFWEVILPLGLGNLIFNISLAYFAGHAYGAIQGAVL